MYVQLGNPETSNAEDWNGLVDYAWSHAVVSDETHRIITQNCDFNSTNPWKNKDCTDAVDEVLKQYKEIDIYSLYTSVCISNPLNWNYAQQFTINPSSNMVRKHLSYMIG